MEKNTMLNKQPDLPPCYRNAFNISLFFQHLIPIFGRLNGRSQTVSGKQQPLAEVDLSLDPDLQLPSSSSTVGDESQPAKRARLEEPASSSDSSQSTASAAAAVKTVARFEEQVHVR